MTGPFVPKFINWSNACFMLNFKTQFSFPTLVINTRQRMNWNLRYTNLIWYPVTTNIRLVYYFKCCDQRSWTLIGKKSWLTTAVVLKRSQDKTISKLFSYIILMQMVKAFKSWSDIIPNLEAKNWKKKEKIYLPVVYDLVLIFTQ